MPTLSIDELLDLAGDPLGREILTGLAGAAPAVVANLGGDADYDAETARVRLADLVCVLVAVGPDGDPLADCFDVVVDDEQSAGEISTVVDTHPIAATSLALLLRGGGRRTVGDGLIAESATYSTLQAGPEHRAWLASHKQRRRPAVLGPAVRLRRNDSELRLTLARPHVRNAYNAATRDALLEGLALAELDPRITRVVIDGDGPAFCSGGDLDEFGTLPDPATAHLLRLTRSAGYAIHRLGKRVTVEVHGACIGAGIELPAFSHRIIAREDATFALPEVSMGLIPGAGGTVSIPRRVGRHRAAWLSLTGRTIDAQTALDWGLIDEITG